MEIRYVNVFVTDLARSIAFYEETLGLAMLHGDPAHGYASFEAGTVQLGLAQTSPDDEASPALPGRHTGVGFGVADLLAEHARLAAAGVHFTMAPERQPWGGFMALFADPDGNVFYLDELPAR